MVQENFVRLVPGQPKRLHFTDHSWVETPQMDPWVKQVLTKRRLVFVVDKEDGITVSKIYSTLRSKEWALWSPMLPDKMYVKFTWEIILSGQGAASEVQVRTIS